MFDLGHTLIDYYNDWEAPENKAIKEFHQAVVNAGADADEGDFCKYAKGLLETGRKRKREEMVEIPLEKVLESILVRYGMEEEEELLKEGFEVFYGVLEENRSLIPGAKDALEKVRDRGYAIGLISDVAWGLPSEYPLRDLEFYGLNEYFDDLVFSTDVGLRKPHPRMFKLALYNLGADASESFYVGNSYRCDIKGAVAAGLKAYLKESGHPEKVDGVIPTAVISSWDELDQYLG
ncbi:MAG: putative HAD-hydrolase [Methanomassiliicoccales archaeon PtaU1.Bin124]|nr:MAG: putative HAD-hydrolase [Methanomassiliicoccales archaeon PtaU1.Bin124]